ncbi:MAG: diacylglycerol kinase family lipid kinase [Lachnospiraceae bacterium]|nr:diacylglycerol kinase family lipid kinase [Lachnospiraceae bacterium]
MYYFIINPTSKSGLGKKYWKRVQPILDEKNIEYQAIFSKKTGHTERIMKELCEEKKKERVHVVILGGDGTVNEAIQGIDDFTKVDISYIPTGSSNDLARDMGISRVPEEALEGILNKSREAFMDMGLVHYEKAYLKGKEISVKDRRFMVGCGIGFDAAVCQEANSSAVKSLLNRLKLGKLTYLGIALKQLIQMELVQVQVLLDNKENIHIKGMFFGVGMVHRYQGGGMMFCPRANPSDGILDFCIASNASKFRVLRLLPTIYKGNHVGHKEVSMYQAKEAVFKAEKPLWVHTDGEVKAQATEIKLSDLGEKIHFIY